MRKKEGLRRTLGLFLDYFLCGNKELWKFKD
jgi:hypothetical protein